MIKFKSSSLSAVLNKKGQVAIFVALIFQVLFLFFAMVINVGLLVHHKINLQNSVDLAAYYGAMKQAENMNAIAHTNYQIRQSWKLLTWRYRGIGTAGEDDPKTKGRAQPFMKDKIGGTLSSDTVDNIDNAWKDFYEAPSFCITYVPFRPMPNNENTCKQTATMAGVKLFRPPSIIAGFQSFTKSIAKSSQFLLDQAIDQCKKMGPWNYLILGKFVVTYNIDQADRMSLINKIARATSQAEDDFYDIDGDSVKEGVEKTLKNNLTAANNSKDLTFEMYNSLGNEACGSSGVAATRPPKWLNTINIAPGFNFIDTICDSGNLDIVGKELVGGSAVKTNGPHHYIQDGLLKADIDAVSQFVGPRDDPDNLNNFTLGVEKNPWCMAYVGVKATSLPNIPFSPFGAVKLSAKAFAKPFGGRIGPWFYKKWPRGFESVGSSKEEQTDPLLPKRTRDPANVGDPKGRITNFSRFIGDSYGLMSRLVLGYSAQAIYKLDPNWYENGAAPPGGIAKAPAAGSPSFYHWDHLPFDFSGAGKSGDVLAWAGSAEASTMRQLELAFVAPNPFDYAYYSIEPDFYHNYYLRLKNGLLAKRGQLPAPQQLRPDIGARLGDNTLESFSVKDQVRLLRDKASSAPLNNLAIKEKQTYMSLNWQHALTGWADKSLIDYSLDEDKFGKCIYPTDVDSQPFLDPPTSGNCAAGGSTGYSVKLISSDYLKKQDLQLGGDSSGTGPIYNPPKDGW